MAIANGKIVAVFFAALMALSLVAMPALASGAGGGAVAEEPQPSTTQTDGLYGGGLDGPPGQGGDGPPGHDRGGDANVTPPTHGANSTVALLEDARDRIDDVELDNESDESVRVEVLDAINASIDEYRADIFADSASAFEHQGEAQGALDELERAVDENGESVDRARDDVREASNASARLGTLAAYETVATAEDDFRNSGQHQRAESALGNAADAIERGETDDSSTATEDYLNAWKHSERAIDAVEENTDPDATMAHGPPVEDGDSITTTVRVEIQDVRPYRYEEVTVTVDDEGPETVELTSDPVPAGSATAAVPVDLDDDLTDRTVSVESTAADDPDRDVDETLEIDVSEDDLVRERPDPDEYAEVEVEDDDSGVTVDVGGDGLHESDVSIANETPETDDEYRAGPTVRIENRTPVDEAEVTVPVDEDAVEQDENLSIVTWDPESDQPWTPVETEIDADEGVASAEVDGFSFFSVFRIDDWEDETSDTIALEDEHVEGNLSGDVGDGDAGVEKADFVFVVDVSGSMSGDRIHYAREAAQRFVGAFEPDERGALVEFESSARLVEGLTADHDALNESIDGLEAGGLTNTGGGLNEGIDELEASGWENRSPVMILLADGQTNRGPDPVSVAEDAAEEGIEISSIGLGSGIDEGELRDIAGAADGDYYHVEESEDLPETFERVAENQTGVDLKDTNDDGIPDVVAEMDLRMPVGGADVEGSPLNLDPIETDTSGDGLADNETVDVEYQVIEENNETKLEAQVTNAVAHPARVDTAGNGLTDYEEIELGTDPLLADTSGDGFVDSVDPAPLEETTPPEVEYRTNDWYGIVEDELIVEARPTGAASEIDEIEVEKHVNSYLRWGSEWQTASVEDEETIGSTTEKEFHFLDERRAAWGEPDEIVIEVTDDDGNNVTIEHDVTTGESAVSAGVGEGVAAGAAFGAATTPVRITPQTAVVGAIAVGVVAAGSGVHEGASVAVSSDPVEGEEIQETFDRPVPETPTEETWETPDGLEITLPSGAVYEDPTAGEIDRGFGWEYITETTSLTHSAIGNAIETPAEIVREEDDVRYVIGEGLSEQEKLIISIIGGTVAAASHTPAYNEDCGATVNIDQGDNPEHALRDGKPIDEVTTLVEVVENPTRVVDAGHKRYYILKLGTNRVVMISTQLIDSAYQVLKTTLTGDGPDNAYRTIDNAMSDIQDTHGDDYQIVHDPEQGIEC